MDMIVMLNFEAPTAGTGVSESAAWTVNDRGAPLAVGVPKIMQGALEFVQLVGSRLRPDGRLPLVMVQV